MNNPYKTITGAAKRTAAQDKVGDICETMKSLIEEVHSSTEIDYRDKEYILMCSPQMIDWCADTRRRLEQVFIGDE